MEHDDHGTDGGTGTRPASNSATAEELPVRIGPKAATALRILACLVVVALPATIIFMGPAWIQFLVLRATGFQIPFMLLVLVCTPLGLLYCWRTITMLNRRFAYTSARQGTTLWSVGFIFLLFFVLLFALLAVVMETNVFTVYSAPVPDGRLSIQDFPLIDATTGKQSEIGQSNYTSPNESPSQEDPDRGAYRTTKGVEPGSTWAEFIDAYGGYMASITVSPRLKQQGVKAEEAAWHEANPAFPPDRKSLLEGKTKAERETLINNWYDDYHQRWEAHSQELLEQNQKAYDEEKSRLLEALDTRSTFFTFGMPLSDFDRDFIQTGKVSFYLDCVDVEFKVYESNPQIFYERPPSDQRSEIVWDDRGFDRTAIFSARQTYTLKFAFTSSYEEAPSETDAYLGVISSSYSGIPAQEANISTVWAALR